jgi:hypothetical protein
VTASSTASEYIQLFRNFRPIQEDESEFHTSREVARALGNAQDHGWDSVLKTRRAVILAEAGNGKTEEFKQQAARLNDAGHFAVFLPIEDLDATSFGDALDVRQAAAFQDWKDSDTHGYFLLDSVDEAKLTNKSLRRCVINLQKAIHGHAERATIIISCRWSDWDFKRDLPLLNDTLALVTHPPVHQNNSEQALVELLEASNGSNDLDENAETKIVSQGFQIFVLDGLDDAQRKTFIQAKGVTNAVAFQNELERNGLLPLASRPKDLLDFVSYWHDHQERLGARKEMISFTIDKRLIEEQKHRPTIQGLPIERLRLGAARLAAAMVLGKTLYVSVSGADEAPGETRLDPFTLLPDWDEAMVHSLLRRGIFTPASLGRAKFHHRETMEYLAAVWFQHLLTNGCPYSSVREQLVATTYDQETIVPSLRPTSAWLACLDERFLRDIIEREPLVLIRDGDPGSIPIPYRRDLLLKYAELHAQSRISDDGISNERLWMFADKELEPTILEIWPDHYEYDLRGDLVRLVMFGQLTGCLVAVRQLLEKPCANRHQGPWALECLIKLADDDAVQEFAKRFMRTYRDMPIRFQVNFAERLFPKYLSTKQLLEVIEHSKKPEKGSIEGFGYYLKTLWRNCPRSDRLYFAEKLADLALRPPFLATYYKVSRQFLFIARHIEPICRDLIEGLDDEDPPPALTKCLCVLSNCDRQEDTRNREQVPIGELFATRPLLKRSLLWEATAHAREDSPEKRDVTAIWNLHTVRGPTLSFAENDLGWLLSDLGDPSRLLDDRKVILSILWRMIHFAEPQKAALTPEMVTARISDSPPLSDYWTQLLAPPKRDEEIEKWEKRDAELKQKEERRRLKEKASWIQLQREIVANPKLLSDPEHWFHYLHNISELLRRQSRAADEHFVDRLEDLDNLFSPEVKEAYKLALREHWRSITPSFENRSRWNQVYARTGVYLEFHNDLPAFRKLPQATARKVIQLGLYDYHSDWVQRLVDCRPEIGLPLVAMEIHREISGPSAGGRSFLYYYARQSTEIPRLVLDRIVDAIRPETLSNVELTDQILAVLMKAELLASHRTHISDIFEQYLQNTLNEKEYQRAAQCLAGLMVANHTTGAQRLLDICAQLPKKQRPAFVVSAIGKLFDPHHHGLALPILRQLEVDHLVSLYKMARDHIPERERTSGVKSLDEIDYAEQGRGAVLSALTSCKGSEAYFRVCELANYGTARDGWYLQHAKRMLERDSEPQPWQEKEVLSFEKGFTAPIKSGRQLHGAVMHALQRISDDLSGADASMLGILKAIAAKGVRDEGALRDAFMSKLIDANSDRFHSAKENHVGNDKRPDIFLASTTCPFQVAIEVKQADYWTGRELAEALQTQLVGQYLYPENRRNGILLLINTGAKRTWQIPGIKRRFQFGDLIAYLAERAKQLSNVGGKEKVGIFSIDVSA